MYSSLDFGLLLPLPRRLIAIPQRRSRMLRMLFRLSIDIPRFSSGPGDTRTELAYQQSQTRTESYEQLNILGPANQCSAMWHHTSGLQAGSVRRTGQ